MEEKFTVKEAFDILRKHVATILMTTFIGVGLAGILTFFVITPQYSSRAQLIVSLPQASDTTGNINDISFNLQMLTTYKDIILQGDAQALEVQNRLSNERNIQMSPAQIKEALQVVQSENSQMFSIQATDENANTAEAIANVVAEVFQETAKDILTNVDQITIVSSAVASQKPVSPNNKLNIAIGIVSGLILGVGLAFLLEHFDRTVKDPRFVTDNLEFIILGTVPQMSEKEINASQIKKAITKTPRTIETKNEPIRRSRSRV